MATMRLRARTACASRRGLPLALALAASLLAPASVARAGDGAGGWGTTTGYTTVMGYELRLMDFGYAWFSREIGATYCGYSNSTAEGAAPLDLPDGVRLDQLQYWAYDTDADNWLAFDVYEDCQAPGAGGEPSSSVLGHGETFGSAGTFYGVASLGGHTVDNVNCHYSVRVAFTPSGSTCVGQALQVQKVRLAWTRQVSPAPATATFNDVPTTHPFFQFVEALAKSGITGGCGPGVYCPDQPLTRGQMAVFLAKALGLVEHP
jgi:hypothetical protein